MSKDLFKEKQSAELKLKYAQRKQAQFQMRVASDSKKVPFRIPFIYKKKLGTTLPITINGVTISIPVDGEQYLIPNYFADVAQKTLDQLDLEEKRSSQTLGGDIGDLSPTGKVPGKD